MREERDFLFLLAKQFYRTSLTGVGGGDHLAHQHVIVNLATSGRPLTRTRMPAGGARCHSRRGRTSYSHPPSKGRSQPVLDPVGITSPSSCTSSHPQPKQECTRRNAACVFACRFWKRVPKGGRPLSLGKGPLKAYSGCPPPSAQRCLQWSYTLEYCVNLEGCKRRNDVA